MIKLPIVHIRAGFRAVVRQPALILGEIAWRWAFGVAAWALIITAIHRILARVDITQAELLIARRSDLFLIADACARIAYQVLPQFARECVVLVPAVAVLWIAAATLGRALTLQSLVTTVVISREDSPNNWRAPLLCAQVSASESGDLHFAPLLTLHCMRAFFTLMTIIAFFGAIFLAGLAMPTQDPTAITIVAILLAALVGFFWLLVNWFLALAPIWIVRDGRPALQSIADAIDLYRSRPGPYIGIASSFGLLRAVALIAAVIAALVGAAAPVSNAAGLALGLVIALIYFAVADFLYMARLASYVALEESADIAAISSQPLGPTPIPQP